MLGVRVSPGELKGIGVINMVTIVVPCHNEAEGIKDLIDQLSRVIGVINREVEVIVVDDGSTDNTSVILGQLKQRFPWLGVIQHKKNYGQSMAIYTGVLEAKGDIIVTLDGDGQNPPTEIPRLLKQLLSDPQIRMVTGWRKIRKDSLMKQISSKIANFLRSSILKDRINDSGCGLRAFYREDFLLLPRVQYMHRFLPFLFKQILKVKVVEIPVDHSRRKAGRGHYGIFSRAIAGIFDIVGMLWLKKRFVTNKEVDYVID